MVSPERVYRQHAIASIVRISAISGLIVVLTVKPMWAQSEFGMTEFRPPGIGTPEGRVSEIFEPEAPHRLEKFENNAMTASESRKASPAHADVSTQLQQAERPGFSLSGPSMPSDQPSWRASVGPVDPSNVLEETLRQSNWYTRVDYFHWSEHVQGEKLLDENGVLWTLGYQRRSGNERFRGEFFNGDVGYSSRVDYSDGSSEPLESHTNYMGVRGEYDLLLDRPIEAPWSFFGGIGTRLWIRDLPDDVTASGTFVTGYQETWWTVYPYLGIEGSRRLSADRATERSMFWSGRLGYTAITYEHGSLQDLRLYPKPSVLGSLECGYRGSHLFLSGCVDWMNWRQSSEMRGWIQPTSSQLTLGLKLGFQF